MIELAANFLVGGLLCNSIPHLFTGLRGERFPSPFAKPPGVGYSHPVVNVIWGLVNAIAALLLLDFAPVTVGLDASFLSAVLGAFVSGTFLAYYFNRLRKKSA